MMADPFDAYPTLFISGLPPTISELDIVRVLNEMRVETKVIIERDPITGAPRVKVIFRYMPDAERFFATVNGSMFLGSKVQLTFKDPNMNFSNTSGAKTIVVKHIPLGVTSLEFYDSVRPYGRIISCKVMIDRSGTDSYALLQFENQDHADKCLREMNGSIFRGNPITLSWQFPKNSPYQYPTHKNAPLVAGEAGRKSPPTATVLPASTENVQVAVAAGWNQPTPPPTPPNTWSSPQTFTPATPISANSPWSVAGSLASTSGPTSPISPQSVTGWHTTTGGAATGWTTTGSGIDLNAAPFQPSGGANAASFDLSGAAALDLRNLYVKNLEDHMDNLELFNLFRAYGRIVSAKVMRDEATGRSKGFGFVSFETEQMAQRALLELNGKRYGSRTLVVNVAEPRGYREKKLQAIHANKQAPTVA
ncbi:Protein phosphatase PP2A regulatory subunit B [Phlyctochytrium bullatum]|nr:Protein phosphatase PP2A regulatory subunit B [Phlyctochytrium bullatum]